MEATSHVYLERHARKNLKGGTVGETALMELKGGGGGGGHVVRAPTAASLSEKIAEKGCAGG